MEEETPGRECAVEAGLQVTVSDVTGRTSEKSLGLQGWLGSTSCLILGQLTLC